MSGRIKIVLVVLLLAVGGAVAYALTSKPAAPPVSVTALNGQTIDLTQLRGQVVLVDFWATSCPGCVEEMPLLTQTYERYKDKGVKVVAVAMNYDQPAYVANFATRYQLPFTVAIDSDGSAAKAFGNVQLTPTSFIINRKGKIVAQRIGNWKPAELDKALDKALAS